MNYLYKIYDYNEKRYNKYVITDERLLDDHKRNMIYTFDNLTNERKKRILDILNERVLKSDIENIEELFKNL